MMVDLKTPLQMTAPYLVRLVDAGYSEMRRAMGRWTPLIRIRREKGETVVGDSVWWREERWKGSALVVLHVCVWLDPILSSLCPNRDRELSLISTFVSPVNFRIRDHEAARTAGPALTLPPRILKLGLHREIKNV